MSKIPKYFESFDFDKRLMGAWDRQPFYVCGKLSRLVVELFPEPAISAAFCRSRALLDRTELIRQGKRSPWRVLGGDDVASPSKIRAALRGGDAIVGRRFDQDHDGAAAVHRFLQSRIAHPTFATLFVTHSLGATFPAHYDSADVFALQITGAKHWELFHRITPPPADDCDVSGVDVEGKRAIKKYRLKAGDLLYVPRGTIHRVTAVGVPAIHISFGVKVLTVSDLLSLFIAQSSATEEMRSALPTLASGKGLESSFTPLLTRILEQSRDPANLAPMIQLLLRLPERSEPEQIRLERLQEE